MTAAPRCSRMLLVLLIAVGAVHAAACNPSGGAEYRSVIVLGFDGLDYELTRELMAAGRLPNLSRLAGLGGFLPLATSFPPQSPVAWSSFTTGLDPAGHGIFDFVHREPSTMEPYLSTTRTDAPQWMLPLGPWQFPLRGGRVVSLRDGQPFWAALGARDIPATIIRMPANYPPSGRATRELSGMGTPDILGTYGTFSFYTSDTFAFGGQEIPGGIVHRVRVRDDVAEAMLEGPANPLRRDAAKLTAAFTVYMDPENPVARIVVDREERVLKVGEWSDWVSVQFSLTPFHSLRGICRFYLKQVRPDLELYVTPVNLDPLSPALPISTPPSFAADLATATGRFYTQGLPEDTKSYLTGVFNRDEFLQQAAHTAAENRRQYEYLLAQFSNGLLFHYFGHVDQVSHMLWRARDPGHPAYDAAQDGPYRHTIDDLYAGLDTIVGQTLDRMPPQTLLVVMSDHGFASWRRSFHLNSWLERRGYLALVEPAQRGAPMFANVDWSRTHAYGLGLNGLYINVKGRERFGTVDPRQRDGLAAEIAAALLATVDPLTGERVVTAVHRAAESRGGPAHPNRAPDLIIGYAKGTRNSSESALGEVPADVMTDNRTNWNGDHCMDPASVPGVVFFSRPLHRTVASLQDLSAAILSEFSVSVPQAGAH